MKLSLRDFLRELVSEILRMNGPQGVSLDELVVWARSERGIVDAEHDGGLTLHIPTEAFKTVPPTETAPGNRPESPSRPQP